MKPQVEEVKATGIFRSASTSTCWVVSESQHTRTHARGSVSLSISEGDPLAESIRSFGPRRFGGRPGTSRRAGRGEPKVSREGPETS